MSYVGEIRGRFFEIIVIHTHTHTYARANTNTNGIAYMHRTKCTQFKTYPTRTGELDTGNPFFRVRVPGNVHECLTSVPRNFAKVFMNRALVPLLDPSVPSFLSLKQWQYSSSSHLNVTSSNTLFFILSMQQRIKVHIIICSVCQKLLFASKVLTLNRISFVWC